jgi:hypothetical protein
MRLQKQILRRLHHLNHAIEYAPRAELMTLMPDQSRNGTFLKMAAEFAIDDGDEFFDVFRWNPTRGFAQKFSGQVREFKKLF